MAGGANYVYGLGGAGPHAVSQVGAKLYSYDANGAMVSGNGKTTTWTSFNKPRKIEDTLTGDKAEFVYGPSRARIKQQIVDNSLLTDVIYIGSFFEKKIHPGDDDELVHYIRAGGAVVAIYTRYDDGYGFTDKTRYLHRDHLGSVESVTDEAGVLKERTSYDPHGKRRLADWQAGTPTTPSETPRGFTGHEHLDSVGLIHMNGRVYDPTLGRFLSADPFVQYPETTQGFNRYSYTDNNPLSYTDPSGFSIFNSDRSFAESPAGTGTAKADPDTRGLAERIWDYLTKPKANFSYSVHKGVGQAIGQNTFQKGLSGFDAEADIIGKAEELSRNLGGNGLDTKGIKEAAWSAYTALREAQALEEPSSGPNFKSDEHELAYAFAEARLNEIDSYGTKWGASLLNPRLGTAESTIGPVDVLAIGKFAISLTAATAKAGYGALATQIEVRTIQSVVNSNGIVNFGGRFAKLDGLKLADEVAHHVPQNAFNKTIGISRANGPAVGMTTTDHSLTRTFAGRGRAAMSKDVGLSARERMAKDIRDLRTNFGSQYNRGSLQAIDYAKTLDQFQK